MHTPPEGIIIAVTLDVISYIKNVALEKWMKLFSTQWFFF